MMRKSAEQVPLEPQKVDFRLRGAPISTNPTNLQKVTQSDQNVSQMSTKAPKGHPKEHPEEIQDPGNLSTSKVVVLRA